MENTSGFYKYEDNELQFGPNFVASPSFTLLREDKDSYEYPVSEWYWFNSRQDALAFFNIQE